MSILILSEPEVVDALPVEAALASQRVAYRAVRDGSARMTASAYATNPDDDSLAFALTGMIAGRTGVVCKFGTQRPTNAAGGLPSVQAFVLMTDAGTGAPLTCLNGTAITTLRTSAGLGVAADLLAPPAASRLAVLGSGVQAAWTIRMIAAVRDLGSVVISSPTPAHRERLATSMRAELGIEVTATGSAREAVEGADIVATCTLSRTPVVEAESAGEPTDLVELGALLTGEHPGRTSDEQIILFHSLGIGLQDAAAAAAAYEAAVARELGTSVAF